jgi:ankyrin repeat protein
MKKPRFIEKVRVARPCSQEWNEMIGNDQVRFCTHCALEVNNLSEMTRKEALRLVRRSEGRLCIRYIKHPESGAPVFAGQLVQLARRAPRMATGVMSAALTFAGFGFAQGSAAAPVAAERKVDEKNSAETSPELKEKAPTKLGMIAGMITDPNGAVIPSVTVALLDEKGNSIRKITTDEGGMYLFEGLKAGNYSISTEIRFFKDSLTSNIIIRDGNDSILNVALELNETAIIVGDIAVTEAEYEGKLAIAVAKDDIDEVRNLIAAGQDVNGREEDRTTPLFIAVENGNREMVQLLLDFGAKINARNDEKETPLMKLDEDASRELVEMLIRAGAKVDAVTKEGNTALIFAAEHSTAEVVQTLIDAGAEIDKQNEEGTTALMKAAESESLEKVQALVLAGASVNLRDEDGDNAWDYTSTDEIEDFLVAHGVVIDPEDLEEVPPPDEPMVDL